MDKGYILKTSNKALQIVKNIGNKLLRLEKMPSDAVANSLIPEICLDIQNLSLFRSKLLECISEDNSNLLPSAPNMRISKEEGIYHYVLDHRLPHRVTFDVSNKKLNYVNLKNDYASGYRAAVSDYISRVGDIRYPENRQLVLFINYYEKEQDMVDHDNIETKYFIDSAINHVFVKDDSPVYLSHLMISRLGEREYTEVYLGNEQAVLELLVRNCIPDNTSEINE